VEEDGTTEVAVTTEVVATTAVDVEIGVDHGVVGITTEVVEMETR
jgi:hypothetical protein